MTNDQHQDQKPRTQWIAASRQEAPLSLTQRLGECVSAAEYEGLPPSVLAEAVRSIINVLGCAIGGAEHESVRIVLDSFAPFAGPEQASIPGRRIRTDGLLASMALGVASHVLDFDDTHPEVIVHPSGPVAAALLPLAEMRGASGRDVITAFVAGIEAECRLARAIMPDHYEAGWHITSTVGIVGAAAACARLLGLDGPHTAHALGIAAAQASGLREMFGSMCKSLHIGRAAQGGLTAALMAQRGFTSSATALEGKRGLIHVMSSSPKPEELTARWWEDFELMRNTYKPFACGLVIHPVLDGCIRLRELHALRGEEIERVDLAVHPLTLELTGKTRPSNGLEGKFSVFHAAAAGLIEGAGGEAQFSDDLVNRPDLVSLRARVSASIDPSMSIEQATVAVTCTAGRRYELRVDHCIGSLAKPLTDAHIDRKFIELAASALGMLAPAALSALRTLPTAPDFARVARMYVPAN